MIIITPVLALLFVFCFSWILKKLELRSFFLVDVGFPVCGSDDFMLGFCFYFCRIPTARVPSTSLPCAGLLQSRSTSHGTATGVLPGTSQAKRGWRFFARMPGSALLLLSRGRMLL